MGAIALGVILWRSACCSQKNSSLATHHAPVVSSSFQRSKIDEIKKEEASSSSSLYQLSKEDLQEFPHAIVVEAAEIEGPEPGQKMRLRILKTDFKYPLIRTEEIVDSITGALSSREEMVASHFLARLPVGEDPASFLRKLGSQAVSIVRVAEDLPFYRVDLSTSSLEALPQALALAGSTSAGYSEPDFIAHAESRPNDPSFFSNQWYLLKSYGLLNEDKNKRFTGINAEDAWNVRTSAASIIVAVVDSGIRYTHEDLAANMWQNTAPTYGDVHGINAINRDANGDPTGDPMDGTHHGTHCAGIIGAVGDNGLGIAGIAWKVQLMACKWLDHAPEGSVNMGVVSDAIVCINYALQHGARILNCSWSVPESAGLFDALKSARDAGVIVVVASGNVLPGNQRINLDEHPRYPACYALDNIVTVAAFAENDTLASFSNYGPKTVHLAAPGVNMYSTWNDSDTSYNYDSGTSMAAACVSGSLALLAEQYPLESCQDLIKRLLDATDKTPVLSTQVQTGRLNLAKALNAPITPEKNGEHTWWEWWESWWPGE